MNAEVFVPPRRSGLCTKPTSARPPQTPQAQDKPTSSALNTIVTVFRPCATAKAALCIQALEALRRTWESGSPEDKQGMTRQMFEYVVFDLDAESITGFQLKPWANDMLVVREGEFS